MDTSWDVVHFRDPASGTAVVKPICEVLIVPAPRNLTGLPEEATCVSCLLRLVAQLHNTQTALLRNLTLAIAKRAG